MQNVRVHRYKNPRAVGYQGWLEPDDQSWIAFVDLNGRPVFFLDREPAGGVIVPPCDDTVAD